MILTMKKFAPILVVSAFSWVLGGLAADSPTPCPSSFYGTVILDGAPVAAGTRVSAWAGGRVLVETGFFFEGAEAVFQLNIPGDDPDTAELEGAAEGGDASFQD